MSEPTVVYKDKYLVAVNKPAGWLTHHVGGKRPPQAPALTDWLLKKYPEIKNIGDEPSLRPGIVHRLDQDTSGIVLVPRTQEYFLYLKDLFKERKVQKTYLAYVHGGLKERKGVVFQPIGIKSGTIRRSTRGGKMQKPATTEYELIEETETVDGEKISLLKVNPLTGRTHQIRVHLRHIGHPILGDKIYGRKKDLAPRLMLHAFGIEFERAPGKRVRLETEPPEDFKLPA